MKINGRPQNITIVHRYIVFEELKEDTYIDISYHCSYYIEETPDQKEIISIHYGPYVLAALSQSQEYITYKIQSSLEDQIKKQPNELRFYDLVNRLELLPLYRIEKQSYHVYMKKGEM